MNNEHPATLVMNDPYVKCSWCAGAGLQDGLYGVDDCYGCKGGGVERDRDAKGRFITHPYTMYHIGDGIYDHNPPAPQPNQDRR